MYILPELLSDKATRLLLPVSSFCPPAPALFFPIPVSVLSGLWRGVDAQLARDVPFSALCWSLLEPSRAYLLHSLAYYHRARAITLAADKGDLSGTAAGATTAGTASSEGARHAIGLNRNDIQRHDCEGSVTGRHRSDRHGSMSGIELHNSRPALRDVVLANFGAGLMAGSFAAVVTNPLDVAKTRRQVGCR